MKTFISNVILFTVVIFFSQHSYSQDVPYVPTPYEVVEGMLELAQVTGDDVVYDLGCGDGRIVVMAAQKYGAKAFGVDSNPQRIKESRQNAKEGNVTDKVEFREQNLFETDLRDATVVTIYLLSSVNLQLRPKLFEELKPGTRVVSNSFDMDEWKPEKKEIVDNRSLYLWIMPVNASGKWEGKASGSNSENIQLQLDQQFQEVYGTLQIGNEKYKITEAKLEENKLQFKAKGKKDNKDVVLRFDGELKENELNGKLSSDGNTSERNLTAQRDPETITPLDPALKEKETITGN